MNRKLVLVFVLLLTAALVVGGCAMPWDSKPAPTSVPPPPTQTARVVYVNVEVTATPVPAIPTSTLGVKMPAAAQTPVTTTVVLTPRASLTSTVTVPLTVTKATTTTAPITGTLVPVPAIVSTPAVGTILTNTLPLTTAVMGKWNIAFYPKAPLAMSSWVFKDPDVVLWDVFPNVDHAGYLAGNGVEYGMAESVFCQTGFCRIPVAAMHYRLITADYNLPGIDQCTATDGVGCAISLWNVGVVTADLKNSEVQQGFTVSGRYWNGDVLPHAVWALMSNTANNMLNIKSALNQGGTNAGANCSVPGGCLGVRMTFVVMSGNEILLKGTTTVLK